ncbi:Rix1 complex component, partial [Aspergillus californicus]
ANSGVRTNLLKLLRVLPENDVRDHVGQLLPYIRASMTHLAPDIRISGIEVLSWLVSIAGEEVISAAGGWVKTLNCFLSVLGWHTEVSSKWTTTPTSSSLSGASASAAGSSTGKSTFGKAGSKGRPQVKVLTVLAEFLAAGIGAQGDDADSMDEDGCGDGGRFPIVQMKAQMIPATAAPYIYLNLFGQPRDEEGEMYETRDDRYRVFEAKFSVAVEKGVEGARAEGGDIGRVAAVVKRVLNEAKQ